MPVDKINYIYKSIYISTAKVMIIFIIEIYNAFRNTILKILWNVSYLASCNSTSNGSCTSTIYTPYHPIRKYLCMQTIKSIQGTKPAVKFCHNLLKSIFTTVRMILSCSYHNVLHYSYNNQKYILIIERDDNIISSDNIDRFNHLCQEFDTIFDYIFQGGHHLKVINLSAIQNKYGVKINR